MKKVENLNEGTTVGTFTVNEMAPEGNYVFSLCTGEGDTHNPYFAIRKRSVENSKETGGRKDIYDPAESKKVQRLKKEKII